MIHINNGNTLIIENKKILKEIINIIYREGLIEREYQKRNLEKEINKKDKQEKWNCVSGEVDGIIRKIDGAFERGGMFYNIGGLEKVRESVFKVIEGVFKEVFPYDNITLERVKKVLEGLGSIMQLSDGFMRGPENRIPRDYFKSLTYLFFFAQPIGEYIKEATLVRKGAEMLLTFHNYDVGLAGMLSNAYDTIVEEQYIKGKGNIEKFLDDLENNVKCVRGEEDKTYLRSLMYATFLITRRIYGKVEREQQEEWIRKTIKDMEYIKELKDKYKLKSNLYWLMDAIIYNAIDKTETPEEMETFINYITFLRERLEELKDKESVYYFMADMADCPYDPNQIERIKNIANYVKDILISVGREEREFVHLRLSDIIHQYEEVSKDRVEEVLEGIEQQLSNLHQPPNHCINPLKY